MTDKSDRTWEEFWEEKQAHLDSAKEKTICHECGRHSYDLKMCEYGDGTADYPHCNIALCYDCQINLIGGVRCIKHAYCLYCRQKSEEKYLQWN